MIFDRLFGRARRAQGSPGAERELFDEEFQRRLEVLALVSRRVASGKHRAERRSKKTGAGIEFADHREYSPGDDFRFLDWKVYGRTDRLLIRVFEEEEDLSVYVLVDTSRSMSTRGGAGGSERSKLDYAKRVAAALAYVALASLDRVSVATFSDVLGPHVPPTRGKRRIFRVFEFLRGAEGAGRTSMADALRAFTTRHKRRGLAVIISDLYDAAGAPSDAQLSGLSRGLDALRHARFEPFVVHLVDPADASPRLHGDVSLFDAETGETREVTVTPALLSRFGRAHEAFCERAASLAAEKQVPYVRLDVSRPWDESVLSLLQRGGLVS